MLHLLQSNKMEVLAAQLAELLASKADAASIFTPDTVWVQSPGMAQWLKLYIAERQGIAANIDFPLPSSYIWQLYRRFVPQLPEQSAFTKANMAWKLMAILPKQLQGSEFTVICQYLQDEQGQLDNYKCYQLSHKIADIFDQYLMYRPHWLLAWETGENHLDDVDVISQPWQPLLWRALVNYANDLGESPYHRANLHQQLLDNIEQAPEGSLPKQLLVFGISAMPRQQLEILQAIGKHSDVFIFWFNPSQHYWGDLMDQKLKTKLSLADGDNKARQLADYADVGNPLLSAWGKLGRDYQDMLLSLDIEQHDVFIEQTPQSLLQCIQRDILQLQFRGSQQSLEPQELLSNGIDFPKEEILPQDHSIQIRSCHAMRRELEVLKDHLLSQFQASPDLKPGDVIVMMPDVASYAPLIDAVFADPEPHLALPYAISDRKADEESPLIQSYLAIMQLHNSRLTLSEVLDIFSTPAISRCYDVQEGEFERLAYWLGEAGVRWGLDKEDKVFWGLPEQQQNTWQFGLERLLAGYALNTPSWNVDSETFVAPYQDIEGQQAQVLGKFYRFFEHLKSIRQSCMLSATIAEKVRLGQQWLELVFAPDDADEAYILQLRQGMEQLLLHQHQYQGDISQDIFVDALQQQLQDKGVGQRFLAGHINFCTLMPMRSIPFKHICLLGMNDGDYPRQVAPLGFDLMRKARPEKGDRSRRHDDRYLFLEALLSAREGLYISFIGRSQKDNSHLLPSVLVNELMQYCQQGYCLTGDLSLPVEDTEQRLLAHILRHEYLQPFNPQYFQAASPTSYQSQWLGVACGAEGHIQTKPFWQQPLAEAELPDTLEIDDFVRFFINPAKGFFSSRWQTQFSSLREGTDGLEPFTLEPLQRYQLRERLVHNPETSDWQTQLSHEGVLPTDEGARLALKPLLEDSNAISQQLQTLSAPFDAERHEVDINLDGIRLQGWLDCIYGNRLLLWRAGKIKASHKLMLWLSVLLAQASDRPLAEGHFIGQDTTFSLELSGVDESMACEQLSLFVQAWQQGLQQPLLFFVETAWMWMKTQDQNKCVKAFSQASGFGNAPDPEGLEPHIQRICPDLAAVFPQFADNAQNLLQGLFSVEGVK